MKLCRMKVKYGWTDKSFTDLLKLMRGILPPNNELPNSMYEAKKILCPMGMDVKKIHARPNDSLFRNDNEDLHVCPKCGASRYKPDGNNSEEKKKRPPAKVVWNIVELPGKTKDGIKARLDMQEMGIRKELAPQVSTKRSYLPSACNTLSRKEKISFCKYLSSVKAPHGYSSNIKKLVSMKDLKLVGLKSHDCHVLCNNCYQLQFKEYYRSMSDFKVIDPDSLDKLQVDIIVTLCQLSSISHFATSYGPGVLVRSYESYDVNGYTFYTKYQDRKSAMQNSGVCVGVSSTEIDRNANNQSRDVKNSYYGVIEHIWELDYKEFKIALFKCKWFIRRGVRVDELGFTLVDFSRFGHEDDPFILATQVKQVFYIEDRVDSKYSIVVQGKRRILGIDDVVDEDEYNQFNENPPFSTELPTSYEDENFNSHYIRNDHDEGMWID
ncbi:uncharacterized protein LOC141701016 [Apium graveolens]|uniref:uncharacterized protein LOC141701016 n=1 Tax=Apium graveolens TaxID=4045 RepID=UPI003D7BB235